MLNRKKKTKVVLKGLESLKGLDDLEGLKDLDSLNEYYVLESLMSLKQNPSNSIL